MTCILGFHKDADLGKLDDGYTHALGLTLDFAREGVRLAGAFFLRATLATLRGAAFFLPLLVLGAAFFLAFFLAMREVYHHEALADNCAPLDCTALDSILVQTTSPARSALGSTQFA